MSFVLPNWRIESEYPSHKEQTDFSFWAWQFLRRNKKYQDDWNSYTNELNLMAKRIPKLKEFIRFYIDDKFAQSDEGKAFRLNPNFITLLMLATKQKEFTCLPSAEQVRSHPKPHQSGKLWSSPRKDVLGRKWGINEIINPGHMNFPPANKFIIDGAGARLCGEMNNYSDDNNYIVPIFDLRLPVDALRAQFEFFLDERKNRITNQQLTPYKGRPHRALASYHDYLRILDAIDSGVKLPEIASIMLPAQETDLAKKKVINWLNAANKIKNETYRLMPAYSEFK